MEEFIAEITDGIGKSSFQDKPKKMSRFKELFVSIANSEPIIRIGEGCDSEGDINMEVLISSLGLDYNNLLKYKPEISSAILAFDHSIKYLCCHLHQNYHHL